jgi:hypothetical protein
MGQLDQGVSDTSLAVIAVVYDAQGVYSCDIICVLLFDYEMWWMLSKGAALTSWPRGTGLSGKREYTSTIFNLKHGHIDQDIPCIWGLCGTFSSFERHCIEAPPNLG